MIEFKTKNRFLTNFELSFFKKNDCYVFDHYKELILLAKKFDLIEDDLTRSFHGGRDYFLKYTNPKKNDS